MFVPSATTLKLIIQYIEGFGEELTFVEILVIELVIVRGYLGHHV